MDKAHEVHGKLVSAKELMQIAKDKSLELLGLGEVDRDRAMRQLMESYPVMHALVKHEMAILLAQVEGNDGTGPQPPPAQGGN